MGSQHPMVVTMATETPPLEKLPKYNIVRNNSVISICYELKYFVHLDLLL